MGSDWEGFVIEQILGALSLSPRSYTPYFLRTSDRYEVDLILEFGRELWAIEIKLTSSPGLSDIQQLLKTADLIDADKRILVSRTNRVIENDNTISCNLDHFLTTL